jgi:hypothetical protein
MWLRLIGIISISSIFISYGVLTYRKSLSSDDEYDFKADFKHTFLTPHWKHSSHHNDNKHKRIFPAMMVIGGIGILVVGLIAVLANTSRKGL